MSERCLYLAAYDDTRTNDRRLQIHWALLIAPKPRHEDPYSFKKSNTRYHVTSQNGHWQFERRHIECVRTPSMLGRIYIGTITESYPGAVAHRLSDPRRIRDTEPGWYCQSWVEEAIADLARCGALHVEHPIRQHHLFLFARKFAEEVLDRGLNVGHGVPMTVSYRPGPCVCDSISTCGYHD